MKIQSQLFCLGSLAPSWLLIAAIHSEKLLLAKFPEITNLWFKFTIVENTFSNLSIESSGFNPFPRCITSANNNKAVNYNFTIFLSSTSSNWQNFTFELPSRMFLVVGRTQPDAQTHTHTEHTRATTTFIAKCESGINAKLIFVVARGFQWINLAMCNWWSDFYRLVASAHFRWKVERGKRRLRIVTM